MMSKLHLLLCSLTVLAVATSYGLASQHEIKPGVERWPIKTSVPAGADLSLGKSVSYADLAKLDDPPGVQKNDHRYQSARIPMFTNALGVKEGDILTTTGWLHLVAGESDGDYHIQISDQQDSQASCVVVEVPKDDPAFVASALVREHAKTVREFIRSKLLKGQEPSPRGSVMQHPPFVEVTGQPFYDDAHVGDPPRGKKGCKAATLWELHPVTEISFTTP
jgi:hypothetical protein